MNSSEVGEVDDGDVGCVCHLRGSLRKPVYGDQLRESDDVDSRIDSVVDNVDVVEAQGATGLEDPVDTKFEQPTSEGATGLEDLGNAPVEPSIEEAINAQNTGAGPSDGESKTQPTDAPQSQKWKRERAAATSKENAPQSQSQSQKQKGKKSKVV
ncbi:Hypothetical predicted protein [Olea europaea subsp. europaea]|uniref:Uncharacterized protein n=1 Tax=Olea europaea subsp. europaea TaxID=158383 RepID=A0A8S0S3C1_OLEEU|nr:Hypothetical predicted protein [Olea europaea subsp. europaea]